MISAVFQLQGTRKDNFVQTKVYNYTKQQIEGYSTAVLRRVGIGGYCCSVYVKNVLLNEILLKSLTNIGGIRSIGISNNKRVKYLFI